MNASSVYSRTDLIDISGSFKNCTVYYAYKIGNIVFFSINLMVTVNALQAIAVEILNEYEPEELTPISVYAGNAGSDSNLSACVTGRNLTINSAVEIANKLYAFAGCYVTSS